MMVYIDGTSEAAEKASQQARELVTERLILAERAKEVQGEVRSPEMFEAIARVFNESLGEIPASPEVEQTMERLAYLVAALAWFGAAAVLWATYEEPTEDHHENLRGVVAKIEETKLWL